MKNNVKKDNWFTLLRLVIFTAIFIAIFSFLEVKLHENTFEHPTWTYVTSSDSEPIDVLFVGNSHTYTSIDAEVISMATDLNVRSLTCSSINGEVVAADIEAFLQYSVPKVIVLEMCPFTVDNFEEMRSQKVGIVFEHLDAIPDVTTRLMTVSKITDFENVPSGTFHLLRNSSMWTRWQNAAVNLYGYDAYGTNKKMCTGITYMSNYNPDSIKTSAQSYSPSDASAGMNERNQEAIAKILDLSKEYDFEVWIYNAPLATFNSTYAEALNYVSSIRTDYPSIKYIDNSMLCLDEIGICKTDFYDAGHLNPNGMQKTTLWMLSKIANRFNVYSDTSNIARYYNSEVTLIEEDLFRYEVNTYSNAMYQFSYKDSSGNPITTDWSNDNWFEETYIPTTEITVNVTSSDVENSEVITYNFLPYTLKGYTANINSDGQLEIINNSNFSNNLFFAWYLTCNDDKSIVKYDYSESNQVILSFEKSGIYTVSAFVKQADSNARISDNILTLQYDENTKEITVIEQIDCVSIN